MSEPQGAGRTRASHDPPRKPWDFHGLVCDARGIGKAERLVLFAMLRWIDSHGILWPSRSKLADAAGLSERGAQKALSALADRGIVSVEANASGGREPDGRGRTPVRRLDALALGKLARPGAAKGAQSAGLGDEADARPLLERAHAIPPTGPSKGADGDTEGRTGKQRRAHGKTQKGEPVAPEPSIEPPVKKPENNHAVGGATAPAEALPPIESVALRDELERWGIKGRNLDRLAASGQLKPQTVREQAQRIENDARIMSKAAALAGYLLDLAGISSKRGAVGPISATIGQTLAQMSPAERTAAKGAAAHLDRLRRDRATG